MRYNKNFFKNRSNKKKVRYKKNFLIVALRNFILTNLNIKPLKNYLSKDNKKLEQKHYKIYSSKTNCKILFLSDLHLDIVNNIDMIKKEVQNEPFFDFIFLGGDYFDKDSNGIKNKKELILLINFLKTKSNNLISIMGNHDDINTSSILLNETNLLINKMIKTKYVDIYGVEDYVSFKNGIDFKRINDFKYNILLSHTPDFIDKVENKYDLMLCGHTHGGQISFFGYKPFKNCNDKKLIYGKWFKNGINGITTSGVGCSGYPFRSGVKPEIVILDIIKKPLF